MGSGPAGCVLANRLSENPEWKVLLLEAGKPETLIHSIPSLATYLLSTESNWGYLAERSDAFCWGALTGKPSWIVDVEQLSIFFYSYIPGMVDQTCAMPRGKSLGGTSSINSMIYNRGNYRDFDDWAAAGNDGWSYAEVLPYFLRSEHANLKGKEESPYHNHHGLLSVEDVPFRTKLAEAFVEGSKEIGHEEVDYNSYTQVGVSYVQANTLHGQRHSAARAFIEPVVRRKNLHILTSARVTRVLIDSATKTAYGVEYLKNRQRLTARARHEVILSTGSFSSPQLLMLSGVGPRHELERIGVPVIHDLPGVGQNMYDHMSHFGPTFIVNSTRQTVRVDSMQPVDIEDFFQGRGLLTTIGVEALNFVKTRNSSDPADLPDVELIFWPGSMASDQGSSLRNGWRFTQELYDAVYRPLEDHNIDNWSVFVMHFHPKSKGYLQLKDKNIFNWPRFYPNYFDDPEDVETMLQGIKEAIRISQSPAMQKLGARLHDIPLPNCAHLHFASDEYWRCSIRTLSCTLHHQVGTCKMGPASDTLAVVDSQLRVHGINRLRVVDTSIIPKPPTAHTNAASFMIGEKAADMIKATWLPGSVET